MKFLLLPKNGKPRFSNRDPWEYIESKKLKIINDWIGFTEDLNSPKLPIFNAININNIEGLNLSLIFLNSTGKRTWDSTTNNAAEVFCKAYCNYVEDVKEDVVIVLKDYNVKDNSYNRFTNKDLYIVRRMIRDAFKWFS